MAKADIVTENLQLIAAIYNEPTANCDGTMLYNKSTTNLQQLIACIDVDYDIIRHTPVFAVQLSTVNAVMVSAATSPDLVMPSSQPMPISPDRSSVRSV